MPNDPIEKLWGVRPLELAALGSLVPHLCSDEPVFAQPKVIETKRRTFVLTWHGIYAGELEIKHVKTGAKEITQWELH